MSSCAHIAALLSVRAAGNTAAMHHPLPCTLLASVCSVEMASMAARAEANSSKPAECVTRSAQS